MYKIFDISIKNCVSKKLNISEIGRSFDILSYKT